MPAADLVGEKRLAEHLVRRGIKTKRFRVETVVVDVNKELLIIRKCLKALCNKYFKKLATFHYHNPASSRKVQDKLKSRKILEGIQFIPEKVKCIISHSFLAVLLFKAYDELFFHGLRSCQRYLKDILLSDHLFLEVDEEIARDNELKLLFDFITHLIGKYIEEYESFSHFLKKLEDRVCSDQTIYFHTKYQFLGQFIHNYFQIFPKAKAIVFCQSSFYKLEICSFLLQFQPFIKPMVCFNQRRHHHRPGFSQKAKNVIKAMFENNQFNVLVRSCNDSDGINFENVDLLIHFDVERHLFDGDLWNAGSENLLSQKIDLFLKTDIEKVLNENLILKKEDNNEISVPKKRKLTEAEISDSYYIGLNKLLKKSKMSGSNIAFDSAFDSLVLNDKFLSKLDAEVYKNVKELRESKDLFSASDIQVENSRVNEESVVLENKKQEYYNLPVSIGDLSDMNCKFKLKESNISIKILDENKEAIGIDVKNNDFECVSPIAGSTMPRNRFFSSSTPLNKDNNVSYKKLKKSNRVSSETDPIDVNDFVYAEFDLFEEWNLDDLPGCKSQNDKSFITISQAMNMVKEAESNELCNQQRMLVIEETSCKNADEHNNGEFKKNRSDLNNSVDMLTGEVIRHDEQSIKNLFADSFNFSEIESVEKKSRKPVEMKKESLMQSIIIDDSKSILNFDDSFGKSINKSKPSVAQKLNFESDTNHLVQWTKKKAIENDIQKIEFITDDSFDAFLEVDLFEKLKTSENMQADSVAQNSKETCSEASTSDIINDNIKVCRKKRRVFNIDESDSADEGSEPSYSTENEKISNNKGNEKISGREFFDLEAEVSDIFEVSSDESVDEEDGYENSFVDDQSYLTQNCNAEMTARYLDSVKNSVNRPGTFKIPETKPYFLEEVFSQVPTKNSDYEIDSFCVDEVEYEEKELSDLEVAEQILELERKKKKKKKEIKKKK